MLVKNNKGQTSIFLLIAALILVIGVVYFLFFEVNLFQDPQEQSQEQVSRAVEFCVQESLDQGVSLIQFMGGRINADPLEDEERLLNFGFDMYSWSEVVTLDDMQEDLSLYVEESVSNCLISNLQSMTDLYEIEGFSEESLNLDVLILDSKVEAIIDMPLTVTIRATNEKWDYSSQRIEIDSALYKNHKLAQAIFLEHQNNHVFEDLVIEQMSLAKDYSNPSNSIPTHGISFSCDTPIWRASEIQNSILSMNDYNFYFLQFLDTKDIENRFSGYDSSIREYYDNVYQKELEFLDRDYDYSNLEVEVVVPKRFGIDGNGNYISNFREFRVNGDDSEFIKPKNLRLGGSSPIQIPIPCVKVYSKEYDLDYDILVEIQSEEYNSLETFRLPIRIQIENSAPKNRVKLSPSITETLNLDLTSTQTIICSEENRENELEIYSYEVTEDGLTPLYDVLIESNCGGIICDNLGEMSNPRDSNEAVINAKLPFCGNAHLDAIKPGYYHVNTQEKIDALDFWSVCTPSQVPDSTFDNEGISPFIDICMVKTHTINLDLDNSYLFDIENVQTITNPQGELVVLIENDALRMSSFASYDYKENNGILEIETLAVDSLTFNISLMYYENNKLKSYYVFEDQFIDELKFKNTFSSGIPILNSGLDSIDDYNSIQDSYETDFLDVEFGYNID